MRTTNDVATSYMDTSCKDQTCTICGKKFRPTVGWLYKVLQVSKKKQQITYQCSYNHWRQAGGDKGYGVPTGKETYK